MADARRAGRAGADGAPGSTAPWRRGVVWALVALAFLVIVVAGALWGLSRAYFVGAEADGTVAVYQGLPFDFTAGAGLYRARYVSALKVSQLSPEERAQLFDHDLLSYDDARARVARYEEQGVP